MYCCMYDSRYHKVYLSMCRPLWGSVITMVGGWMCGWPILDAFVCALVCVYVYTHIYIHSHIHHGTYIHTCIHKCVCVQWIHTQMDIHVHTYKYTHIHTHTHTHTFQSNNCSTKWSIKYSKMCLDNWVSYNCTHKHIHNCSTKWSIKYPECSYVRSHIHI